MGVDKNKRLEYENRIFRFMMADALHFKHREELNRSFMIQYVDYDEDCVELYFPDIYEGARYDEIALSSTIDENEAGFTSHVLDEDSRQRFHELMHPDREKIIKDDIWCYDGMLFIEQSGVPHYLQYYHLYDIDDNGHLIAYVMTVIADIFTKEWEKIQRRAQRDQLTRLYNRYMFQEVIIQFREEHINDPAVIVELDADKFKEINDTYGHDVGDEALMNLTRRMHQVFYNRNQMVLFRLGGDEFAIFMKGIGSAEAKEYAEEMAKEEIVFEAGGKCISFTVSVGYSEMIPGDTVETALKRADDAMYKVKRGGGKGALEGV